MAGHALPWFMLSIKGLFDVVAQAPLLAPWTSTW